MQSLEERLPVGPAPPEEDEVAFTLWREDLQRALIEAFCDVNEEFACKGEVAGSTITVVLQVHLSSSSDNTEREGLERSHAWQKLQAESMIGLACQRSFPKETENFSMSKERVTQISKPVGKFQAGRMGQKPSTLSLLLLPCTSAALPARREC